MHAMARRAGASKVASSARSALVASLDAEALGAAAAAASSATSGLERKVDIKAANIFELPVAAPPRKFQAIRKCW